MSAQILAFPGCGLPRQLLPAEWTDAEYREYEMLTGYAELPHDEAVRHVAAVHAVGPRRREEKHVEWLGRQARAIVQNALAEQERRTR